MINDWMNVLATQTVVLSALLIAIFSLRPLTRRAFGSRATYFLWLIVPLAFAAQLIPVQPRDVIFTPILVSETLLQPLYSTAAHVKNSSLSILFGIWMTGVCAVLGYFVLHHARFVSAMGMLHPQHNYFTAETQGIGPVLIGIWRPRIVMPLYFERDFADHEKALMLAHEQTHQQRRDPMCNLMCAGLLALWWFHPLAYIAASRFRYDQELACDAIVLAQYPQYKRIYADTLLKISGHFQAGLIHCHFPHQPLRERIMEIFRTEKNQTNRTLGTLLIATLIASTSYAAWASNHAHTTPRDNPASQTEQANAQAYVLSTQLNFGEQTSSPRILVREGQAAKIVLDMQGERWEVSFLVTHKEPKGADDKLDIKITAKKNQDEVLKATLWLGINEPGAVQIANPEKNLQFDLKLKASKQTNSAS